MTVRGRPQHVQRPGDAAVGLALRHEAARLKLVHAIEVCRRSGLKVVADVDAMAIRLIPVEEYRGSADLRKLGITVPVDSACGSTSSMVGGDPITHGG